MSLVRRKKSDCDITPIIEQAKLQFASEQLKASADKIKDLEIPDDIADPQDVLDYVWMHLNADAKLLYIKSTRYEKRDLQVFLLLLFTENDLLNSYYWCVINQFINLGGFLYGKSYSWW